MSEVLVEAGIDAGLAWHFGDPLAEQRVMLAGRGVVGLANREVFTITGPQRIEWLNQLTTSTFTAGQPGAGLILDAQGHVVHAFAGVDDGQCFTAWAEPGAAEPLVDWLGRMKFWTKADVELRPDLTVLWLGSAEATPQDAVELPDPVGDGRLLIMAHDDAVQVPGAPVGIWAYEALRIAAGVPRVGVDTDARTIPNEIGLFATVLGKGCYPGQETVARIHALGRPPRRLVGLLMDGSEERLPECGSQITLDDKQVGVLGSAAQHFELGPVGLALIKRNVPVDATLLVDGLTANQEILVDPDVGEHFRPNL